MGLPTRQESLVDESGSRLSGRTPEPSPTLPTTTVAVALQPEATSPSLALTPGPKKRVTIADYKRRREASRTDSTEREEEEDLRLQPPYMSLSAVGSHLPPLTSLPELPGLESRRSNHHQQAPPHKAKESSPKRGSAVVRKHEKWESKSKETSSKGKFIELVNQIIFLLLFKLLLSITKIIFTSIIITTTVFTIYQINL